MSLRVWSRKGRKGADKLGLMISLWTSPSRRQWAGQSGSVRSTTSTNNRMSISAVECRQNQSKATQSAKALVGCLPAANEGNLCDRQ